MKENDAPPPRERLGALAQTPVLGIALTQGMFSGEGTARRTRLFRRALSIGIAMFDLTTSTTPLLDIYLIEEVNREFDRPLTLIIPLRVPGDPTPGRPPSSTVAVATELGRVPVGDPLLGPAAAPAMRPRDNLWVELPVEEAESSANSDAPLSLPPELKGPKVSWVVRWDSSDQLDGVLHKASRLEGAIVSGPASLLDPRGPIAVGAISPPGTRRYLARDPYAGGRLDGSLLELGNLDRNPNEGPLSLERLQEEYGPVLPFGFLSKPGIRNLRVAALQYLRTLPSVLGIVVPIASERQLEELERIASAPPLEPEELDRIAQLQTRRRAN
jgi:hypothetical protein